MVLVCCEIEAYDFDDVRVVSCRQCLTDFDLPGDVALVLYDLFDRDHMPGRCAAAKDRAEGSLPESFLEHEWRAWYVEDLIQLRCSLSRRPSHCTCNP